MGFPNMILTPRGEYDGETLFALDGVIRLALDRIAAQRLPNATYRLQFNADFTFRDAARIAPYLHELGITDCYSSPFLQARPGSPHGYDVVNHGKLNAELGTAEDFEHFVAELRRVGVGQILDVVPNHMSAAAEDNPWWLDVLENGPSSAYANFFDIDWMPLKPDLANKVLLPVLGDQFGRVLEDAQLLLHFDDTGFCLHYHQRRFPIAPDSYATILAPRADDLRHALGEQHADVLEYLSILTAIHNLPPRTETDPARIDERRREKEVVKRRLQELVARSAAVREQVAAGVREFNGTRGDPRSFDRLDDLLQQQAARLADWRVAADEINYRRFFDINDLAAICMENPVVFQQTHRLIFDLLRQQAITGLRIDHPDGLYDPSGYLQQLQEARFVQICQQAWEEMKLAAQFFPVTWEQLEQPLRERWRAECRTPGAPLAQPLFVVVEKILEGGEQLPQDWLVRGTVGYEFLNTLNGVFVNLDAERACSAIYQRFTGETGAFRELVYRAKRLITRMVLASELMVLGHQLDRISERNRWTRDFTLSSLTRALQEVIACFDVYRTYIADGYVLERDRRYVETAVARAKRRNPAMTETVFDFLGDMLLLRYRDNADESERDAQRRFVGKFQQLTGPIMAKAVEDTVFYVYNRLVSLNEVGGEPQRFGVAVAELHRQNHLRRATSPRGLTSTTTHDTKRSEDVRARIDVLSEIPKQWREAVFRWARWNKSRKTSVDGQPAPSRNDEYLLYQILVGCWPGSATDDLAAFSLRIQEYMLKAVREAKVETSWINPNAPYELAITNFMAGLLSGGRRAQFLRELDRFARAVAEHGIWNSLAQVLLKIGSPGVPDFFQGTELWTLTLVDPDNRRPVDYELRQRLLADLRQRLDDHEESNRDALPREILESRADGRIKLYVTLLALQTRNADPDLFTRGEYIPLEIRGEFSENVIAFARRHETNLAIIVVPRLTVRVVGFGGGPPLGDVWSDTQLIIPSDWGTMEVWKNAMTQELVRPTTGESERRLSLCDLLRSLPVALLRGTLEAQAAVSGNGPVPPDG